MEPSVGVEGVLVNGVGGSHTRPSLVDTRDLDLRACALEDVGVVGECAVAQGVCAGLDAYVGMGSEETTGEHSYHF